MHMGASGGMTVRAASLDDLDAIEALEFAAFPGDRLSRRSLRGFIRAAHRPLIVAKFGDRLAGYALIALRKGGRERAALFARRRSRARAARRRPRAAAGLRALRARARSRRRCGSKCATTTPPPSRFTKRWDTANSASTRATTTTAPPRCVSRSASSAAPGALADVNLGEKSRRTAFALARCARREGDAWWRRDARDRPDSRSRRDDWGFGFSLGQGAERPDDWVSPSKPFARSPRRGATSHRARHERLGDSRRSRARLPQRGDAAQGHHHQRLSGAAETVRRGGTRQDRQPLAILQLSIQGLLRLAARRGARASHHPHRRDHARTARAQALRAVAARLAGGAQHRRAPRARQRDDDLRSAVLFRPVAGPAIRSVRPAAVRLVSLPGDRGDDHAGQAMEDRPSARAPARQARPGGGRVLSRRAAPAHPTRLAQPARARRRQIFARGALRSAGRTAAFVGGDHPLLSEVRRAQFGRSRTAHQTAVGGAGRIRRAVHPRDDLDRQLHLPLRAPRPAGGHAGRSTIPCR